jgi:hypothetical protein
VVVTGLEAVAPRTPQWRSNCDMGDGRPPSLPHIPRPRRGHHQHRTRVTLPASCLGRQPCMSTTAANSSPPAPAPSDSARAVSAPDLSTSAPCSKTPKEDTQRRGCQHLDTTLSVSRARYPNRPHPIRTGPAPRCRHAAPTAYELSSCGQPGSPEANSHPGIPWAVSTPPHLRQGDV